MFKGKSSSSRSAQCDKLSLPQAKEKRPRSQLFNIFNTYVVLKSLLESGFLYPLSTGTRLFSTTVTRWVSQCPSFLTSVCSDLLPRHPHSPSSGHFHYPLEYLAPLWSLACPLIWIISPLLTEVCLAPPLWSLPCSDKWVRTPGAPSGHWLVHSPRSVLLHCTPSGHLLTH